MAKRSHKHTSRRRNRNWPLLAGVAAVVLVLGGLVVYRIVESANLPGERFASQGNTHIRIDDDHPAYNSNPPTSGWHTPDLAAWGTYDYVVPDERLIHNMEDGGVILWYRMGTEDENADRIAELQQVARGYPRTVIAPREEMPTRYALTAWQRLQRFEDIDQESMRAFIDSYHGIDHHSSF
jgi:hypothetical protein